MLIHRGIEQGSDEWKSVRLGMPTASRFKDVLAKWEGKTRMSYMYQLAAETLTGQPDESYSNQFMEWGVENEPLARSAYEFITGDSVEQVTFISNEKYYAGYSPDGLVGNNGLIEIKCPKTTTHIETVISGKMPSVHIPQVQGGLMISEREWLDFISYDPRIKQSMAFFCVRVYRDDDYIEKLRGELIRFNNDLADLIAKFESKREV